MIFDEAFNMCQMYHNTVGIFRSYKPFRCRGTHSRWLKGRNYAITFQKPYRYILSIQLKFYTYQPDCSKNDMAAELRIVKNDCSFLKTDDLTMSPQLRLKFIGELQSQVSEKLKHFPKHFFVQFFRNIFSETSIYQMLP